MRLAEIMVFVVFAYSVRAIGDLHAFASWVIAFVSAVPFVLAIQAALLPICCRTRTSVLALLWAPLKLVHFR